MNILFFTSSHLNLYKYVVKELTNQRHNVTVIKSPYFPNDPKFSINTPKKDLNKEWDESVNSFWRPIIDSLSSQIDLFICFNAPSINKTVLNRIDFLYPQIKKIIYVWDSFNYVNFDKISSYFDVAYSFDYNDCHSSNKWILLPPFYLKKDVINIEDYKYDIFCIGFNHDNRYKFITHLMPQIRKYNLKFYIKIKRGFPSFNMWGKIKFIIKSIQKGHYKNLMFEIGLKDRYLGVSSSIPGDEFYDAMEQSKCVLDDNRENQGGLSPRFIWAYFNKKLIITTNKWAHCYSFVDKKRVLIIDKESPIIDKSFLNIDSDYTDVMLTESLYISNWVNILIGKIKCPNFAE